MLLSMHSRSCDAAGSGGARRFGSREAKRTMNLAKTAREPPPSGAPHAGRPPIVKSPIVSETTPVFRRALRCERRKAPPAKWAESGRLEAFRRYRARRAKINIFATRILAEKSHLF
jgi:hypothetical protein